MQAPRVQTRGEGASFSDFLISSLRGSQIFCTAGGGARIAGGEGKPNQVTTNGISDEDALAPLVVMTTPVFYVGTCSCTYVGTPPASELSTRTRAAAPFPRPLRAPRSTIKAPLSAPLPLSLPP